MDFELEGQTAGVVKKTCRGGCPNFVEHSDGSHECKTGGCGFYVTVQQPWKTQPGRTRPGIIPGTTPVAMVQPSLIAGVKVAPMRRAYTPRRKNGFAYGEDEK